MGEEEASGRDPIPLIEQLDSMDAGEREEALETLEQVVTSTPELIPQLVFETQLADKLNSRVCDAKSSIRQAAVSLIRTLAQTGEEAVVDHLVAADVLTPLLDVFSKTKVTVAIVDAGVRGQVQGILSQVLGALHELCQRSETAVNFVADSPHAASLLDYLDPAVEHVPAELRCAAAHVLQDLVEDCPVIVNAMRSSARAQQLVQGWAESTRGSLLLRALCCGVRFELDGDCARCVQGLQPALALQLPITLMGLKNEAVNAGLEMAANDHRVANQEEPMDAKDEGGGQPVEFPPVPHAQLGTEGEASKVFSGMLGQWLHAAQAQQQALETLANVFGSQTLAAAEALVVEASLPPLVAVASLQLGTVEACFGEALLAAMPAVDGCVDKLQLLQLRAIHCLSNALIAVPPQRLAPWTGALWLALMDRLRDAGAALADLAGPRQDDELLDGLAQCAWAVARTELKLPVSPEHVAMLCSLLAQRLSAGASVACAGALGSLAGYFRPNEQALSGVTRALVACAVESSPPLLLAEAVNSLIDIFSDDATHAVYVGLQVGKTLAAVPPLVKRARARAQAREEEDLERLFEVADNVQPFLAYKKNN
jgi:hypothetical protein